MQEGCVVKQTQTWSIGFSNLMTWQQVYKTKFCVLQSKNTDIASKMVVKVVQKVQNGARFHELALPGMKGILKPKQRLWKRILWVFVTVVSLTTCAFQIILRVERYLSFPITVSVTAVDKMEMIYPALTMCPYSPFDTVRFADWKQNLTGDPNYDNYQLLDIPGVDLNLIWNMTGEDVTVFTMCLYGDPPESCLELWKTSFLTPGLCYTLELGAENQNNQLRREYSGIDIRANLSMASTWPRNLLWQVLLHDRMVDPTFEAMMQGQILVKNANTRFRYLEKKFRYLNTTMNPCVTQEEFNNCLLRCYTSVILEDSNCKDPSMKISDLPLCNNSRDFKKIFENPRVFTFQFNSTLCVPCTRSCTENIFEVHSDSYAGVSDVSTVITIDPLSTEIFLTTENYAYDSLALFCDIGGALGLYLGVSLMTIIEILDIGIGLCFRTMFKMKKAN